MVKVHLHSASDASQRSALVLSKIQATFPVGAARPRARISQAYHDRAESERGASLVWRGYYERVALEEPQAVQSCQREHLDYLRGGSEIRARFDTGLSARPAHSLRIQVFGFSGSENPEESVVQRPLWPFH